jgi:hypothetical protein
MRKQSAQSMLMPSLIATPEVLAAFRRAMMALAQTVVHNLLTRVVSICNETRLALFQAIRALSSLFGDVASFLDNQACIRVQDFAILPLHHRIKSPTLYAGYLALQSNTEARSSDDSDNTISNRPMLTVSTSNHSASISSASHEYLGSAGDHGPKEEHHTQAEPAIADDGNDEKIWEMLDDNKSLDREEFPSFIDCLCLQRQGYDVPHMHGDHHNTECDCHSFTPVCDIRVSCQGHSRTSRTSFASNEEWILFTAPLNLEAKPTLLSKTTFHTYYTKGNNWQSRKGSSGLSGEMKDSGYNSSTNDDVPSLSGLREKLAVATLRLRNNRKS